MEWIPAAFGVLYWAGFLIGATILGWAIIEDARTFDGYGKTLTVLGLALLAVCGYALTTSYIAW